MTRTSRAAFAAAGLCFYCTPASADVGLPMIAVYLPPAWLALIPIILIEARIGAKMLDVARGRLLIASAVANSVSTLLGLPLAWLALATIEGVFFGTARGLDTSIHRVYAVTIQAPWLIPYER